MINSIQQKNIHWVIFGLVLCFLAGCLKENYEPRDFIEATTIKPIDEGLGSVILQGKLDPEMDAVKFNRSGTTLEYGFLLSEFRTDPVLDREAKRFTVGSGFPGSNGTFNHPIEGLSVQKVHYFQAWVEFTIENGETRMHEGEILEIDLQDNVSLSITEFSPVDNSEALVTGVLILKFQKELDDHGFICKIAAAGEVPEAPLDTAGNTLLISRGPTNVDGEFEERLLGLDFNTTYHCWSYGIINDEVIVSDDRTVIEVRDGWKQILTTTQRSNLGIGASTGSRAFFGMGCNGDCEPANAELGNAFLWELDLDSDSPVSRPDLTRPHGREGAISFVMGDQLYFGLGLVGTRSGTYYDDFWRYNTTDSSWTQLDNFPGTARNDAVVFTLDKKAYIGLGYSFDSDRRRETFHNDFFVFDTEMDQWNNIEEPMPLVSDSMEFPIGRRNATAVTTKEGKAFVGGGRTKIRGDTWLSDYWEFHPDGTERWTRYKDGLDLMDEERELVLSAELNEVLYIGLGNDGDTKFADFYQWDPISGIFSAMTPFPREKTPSATLNFAFALNGKVYVGGSGPAGAELVEIWEYTPLQ